MRRRTVIAGARGTEGEDVDLGFPGSPSETGPSGEPDYETAMTARDRTVEFGAAVRTLRGGALRREDPSAARRPASQRLAAYSDFMRDAKLVSKNVAATYSKLEKLAALAGKRSLFDDRPAEIQELTYIIKGDLGALNRQIAALGDMPRGRRHVQSHSSNVVLALQSRLAGMSAHFKRVLELRSENLRRQNDRREKFARAPPAPALAQAAHDDDEAAAASSALSPLLQSQRTVLRDRTDDYVAQRAETMQNIESTIVELGGIFQQLAHMVKEQDEAVTRIDANLEDAELNVEAAHAQILKYFQSVTGNRALMLKVFGVLILFFVFFVVVLA